MKKITNTASLFFSAVLFLATTLLFSSCSSNKQYFSFTPAPPAYVKKAVAAPAEEVSVEPTVADVEILTASTAPEQAVVLPEVAAIKKAKAQPQMAAALAQTSMAAPTVEKKQKLTLAQKVVLHKVQKQVKKLSAKGEQSQAAAGPVSNRNAIALILIGLIVAVFGSFLGSLFYTLGVLILLVGLVLLILNYV